MHILSFTLQCLGVGRATWRVIWYCLLYYSWLTIQSPLSYKEEFYTTHTSCSWNCLFVFFYSNAFIHLYRPSHPMYNIRYRYNCTAQRLYMCSKPMWVSAKYSHHRGNGHIIQMNVYVMCTSGRDCDSWVISKEFYNLQYNWIEGFENAFDSNVSSSCLQSRWESQNPVTISILIRVVHIK